MALIDKFESARKDNNFRTKPVPTRYNDNIRHMNGQKPKSGDATGANKIDVEAIQKAAKDQSSQ